MFDRLVETFGELADFCKSVQPQWEATLVTDGETPDRKHGPEGGLCDSEIMTLLVLYHGSRFKNFKTFYNGIVLGMLRPYFRRAPLRALIGIGGRLAASPLPHHRAYGSVPRRFDRVKLEQKDRGGEDRGRRNTSCAGPVGPPDVLTCARTRSASRRQPPPGTSARHGAAVSGNGCARSAIVAKDTNVAFGGSMPPGW